MKYDFDNPPSRRNSNSYKWDSLTDPNTLPLWVADMDFAVAPCIQEAIQKRAQHPIYGYVKTPDSYYQSAINWFASRHNWRFEKEWMIPTIGVVPAISAIIQALTQPGDQVLVCTPVYNCFFSSIRNSGCILQESHLFAVEDQETEADITWKIDFEDFEKKAADPATRLFLLCNPHNPTGRIWSKEELQRLGEICIRHNVFIISDEIHNELTTFDNKYTPFASIDSTFELHSATCLSPSKSFNIAGLQNALIVAKDPLVRQKIDKQININEVCDVNPFGVEALQAAYSTEGAKWLDELNLYLTRNYQYLLNFFHNELPNIPVTRLEGTYLVWIDCTSLGKDSHTLEEELLHYGIWFNSGKLYDPSGSTFLRINIACPLQILEKALERFKVAVTDFCRKHIEEKPC